MKFAAALFLCLSLMACETVQRPSLYERSSFKQLDWAKKSFDEMMSRCRHTSLHRDRKTGLYIVERPLYEACMDHYGYHYLGGMDIKNNDMKKQTSMFGWFPDKPTTDASTSFVEKDMPSNEDDSDSQDKSALYR